MGRRVERRWEDGSGFGRAPDWRMGIRSMVAYGVAAFRNGECPDGLRFDCFNTAEVDLVRELMGANPDIPFSTTQIVPPAPVTQKDKADG